MALASKYHITCWIDKGLRTKVKKKVLESENNLHLKDYVEAGLILVADKNETQIRNILKRYSNKGGDL